MRIDYDNSLLAMISSVLKYYNVPTEHKTLPQLDALLGRHKNTVIMLFDGMGTEAVKEHLPSDSFLRKNLQGSISSVFPPTTTAATITVETGLAPAEHAWLGWSLFFDEISDNVNLFPNTLSGSNDKPAANYHVADTYIPIERVYRRIEEATNNKVSAHTISPFSFYQVKSVSDICINVKDLCNLPSEKYIYTYWYQPDFDMHSLGVSHERIKEHIKSINEEVEHMCENISDTLVIVTADHGLIDTSWRYLDEYSEILSCLSRKPSIEARAASFPIKTGMFLKFERLFNDYFGDIYKLYSKAQILDEKWFGDGAIHKRLEGFIGDYIAIATGNVSIDYTNNGNSFKAAHAGMTAGELNVPFIVIECE